MTFIDRRDAGMRLARRLGHLAGEDVVVLGAPCGGVLVAAPVAAALAAPLDVAVTREVRVPARSPLVLGAVGEEGVLALDDGLVRALRVGEAELAAAVVRERAAVDRFVRRYRGGRPGVPIGGRTVVLVADGVAVATPVRTAVAVLRARGARRVVLAVPVGAPVAVDVLAQDVDELVVLARPAAFREVAASYVEFHRVDETEVVAALREQAAGGAHGGARVPGG
ncbi:phosphoribosyltransferase family protein [Actinomycetospora straminea]|uniref:Phosphoribosyltransferase n=1 Tax=Actinomycetospora straminea TaxID=663607 RepID=A0ABP9EJX0_9PSEU|nr:phosphoribosyltransferase family protein [Actinomycetospora straminea]MDD7933218.1 phosphoribosyltransferase family protein [Actinomycetospora straminea]